MFCHFPALLLPEYKSGGGDVGGDQPDEPEPVLVAGAEFAQQLALDLDPPVEHGPLHQPRGGLHDGAADGPRQQRRRGHGRW